MAKKKLFPHPSTLPLAHPRFVMAGAQPCALTSRSKVSTCLIAAISARYNQSVTESTKLGMGGLGLDDTMIKTDLYAVVVFAVHNAGCRLRSFGPDDVLQCKTVGKVVDGVWNDLIAP